LYAYDKYLDNIRTQKAIEEYQREVGFEQGKEAGFEEGKEQGKEEGMLLTISIYKDLQSSILSHEAIALKYAISLEEVKNLAAEFK
jgi:predicted transposase YdaD